MESVLDSILAGRLSHSSGSRVLTEHPPQLGHDWGVATVCAPTAAAAAAAALVQLQIGQTALPLRPRHDTHCGRARRGWQTAAAAAAAAGPATWL